jgi:hypothetical protein
MNIIHLSASNLSSSIDFAYGDENIRSSTYSPETIARLARHLFTHQEGIKIAAFLVKRYTHEISTSFTYNTLQ